MNRAYDHYQAYTWHQSHDQATVLVYVPPETEDEDVEVIFERNYLVAGVKGKSPLIKGLLYGTIDVGNSVWQLEARTSRLSARERTTSTTSTASTQSSFAVVSDAEITSSFAASLEGGFVTDFEESLSSPALSSPVSLSGEDSNGFPLSSDGRRRTRFTTSHYVSPPRANRPPSSMTSSISSLESMHQGGARLLTIHLEKADSMIWPSLIIGPVLETLSPANISCYPWTPSSIVEARYNMDPTSLVLLALDLCDIRGDREEAFEYFIRAWHQAHVPSATIRLATFYIPVHAVPPELLLNPAHTPSTPTSASSTSSPDATPTVSHAISPYAEQTQSPIKGTLSYYIDRVGGVPNLAVLYLEAGLLYLEGSAAGLLSSSYNGLSSLRTPNVFPHAPPHTSAHAGTEHGGAEAWTHDQTHARRFFHRARELHPALDVPLLPASNPGSEPESADADGSSPVPALHMPTLGAQGESGSEKPVRRRRRKDTVVGAQPPASVSSKSAIEDPLEGQEDNTWYLYLPGLVGAGTALLVVGFLSFSSWRKGQGT